MAKPSVAERMRDPRFAIFRDFYLQDPPDPARLSPDYRTLPVEERARRYALFMVKGDEDLPK